MNPTVTASIIAAVVAIVGPILTLFVKRWLDERPMRSISTDRIKAIEGDWSGQYTFIMPPDTQEHSNTFACTLIVRNRKITARHIGTWVTNELNPRLSVGR